jgi:hypothetical protein
MTIPKNRPVIWQDIEDARIKWDKTHSELCTILGILQYKWTEIRRDPERMNAPVDDPSLAILMRLYDDNVTLVPEQETVNMRAIYEMLNEQKKRIDGEDLKKRHFSPHFGRNSSAGYTWIDRESPPTAVVARIAETGKILADTFYEKLAQMSQIESAAREVDPFKTGKWKI